MSAIAGVWNLNGEPVSARLLEAMSSRLSEFGPDGSKSFVRNSIGALYCANRTTKESQLESQPFVLESGRIVAWDGRLDNREDLLDELSIKETNQTSDLAIVVALFERKGTSSFTKLRGDWACSIWNPADESLILAKDYAGVRPLFYHVDDGRVMWSSHLGPIVFLSNKRWVLNDEYVAGYLAWYPATSLTPYKGIASVPPASFVRITRKVITVTEYWQFDGRRTIRYKTDSEYEDHFRYLFRQAVRRRLRSKSPVLAELSGGLDSSSIVCMADQLITEDGSRGPTLDTLSYFNTLEPGGDERPYFSKVEERRGRKGHHFDLAEFPVDFLSNMSRFAAVPGPYLLGIATQGPIKSLIGRQGYRVVISGTGGDEFLGGAPDPTSQLGDALSCFRLRSLWKQLHDWSLAKRQPRLHLLLGAFRSLLPMWLKHNLTQDGRVPPWINERFSKKYGLGVRQLGPNHTSEFVLPTQREFQHSFEVFRQGLASGIPGPVAGEERRYPYLDRDLIEFLFAIPATQILRPGERRSLMRRALTGLLPVEILQRKTKAYAVRYYMTALTSNWGSLDQISLSPLSAELGYFGQQAFRCALLDLKHGQTTHFSRMIRAIALEIWLQNLSAHRVAGLQGSRLIAALDAGHTIESPRRLNGLLIASE